jgi:hypothetical protein
MESQRSFMNSVLRVQFLSSHEVYNTLPSHFVLHEFAVSSLPGSAATLQHGDVRLLITDLADSFRPLSTTRSVLTTSHQNSACPWPEAAWHPLASNLSCMSLLAFLESSSDFWLLPSRVVGKALLSLSPPLSFSLSFSLFLIYSGLTWSRNVRGLE